MTQDEEAKKTLEKLIQWKEADIEQSLMSLKELKEKLAHLQQKTCRHEHVGSNEEGGKFCYDCKKRLA
jgi:hypothetical protein